MSYSIPECFMAGFLLGLAFSLVYEALRIIRVALRHRAVVFVCDVVFFALAGFAVFRLSMVLGNYVRIYTLIGFAAGVFAYITTLGRLMNRVENTVLTAVRRSVGKLLRRVGGKLRPAFGAFAHKAGAGFGKFNVFLSSGAKKAVSPLKSAPKKMYNKNTIKSSGKAGDARNVIKAKVTRRS